MHRRLPFTLILLLFAAACSGGGHIETVPGPVYLIAVENPMSHVMDVWYDDGRETAELGRVDAGATREFVIAGPDTTAVRIIARDEGRTHTVTRTIELTRPAAVQVVLTP